jgi:hypothetical protein
VFVRTLSTWRTTLEFDSTITRDDSTSRKKFSTNRTRNLWRYKFYVECRKKIRLSILRWRGGALKRKGWQGFWKEVAELFSVKLRMNKELNAK